MRETVNTKLPVQEGPRVVAADLVERDEPRVRTVRYEFSLRSMLTILGIVFGVWLFTRVWQTILLCLIALVIAATFSPVVTAMERRGLRRPVALAIVLLGLLLAVFGLGALVIPGIASQIGTITETAPRIQQRLADFLATLGPLAGQAERVRSADPTRYLGPVNDYVLAHAGQAAETVVLGFTTVVLAFYLIADHERVQGFLFALLPRQLHLRTARMLLDMETVVGGYMRGQAITSLCIGVFTFVVLAVTRTPNALALAILAALGDLIPFVGPVLAVVPAAVFALIKGPIEALIVFVALVLYHQFESHLLVPRVYGKSLRLSPVAVIVALLIGGQLLGIVGALLALPLAAGMRVLVENYRIELPGEVPGEDEEREVIEQVEAEYAVHTEGATAVEAATVATALAEQMQETTEAVKGEIEVPAEERGASGPRPLPFPNPARE